MPRQSPPFHSHAGQSPSRPKMFIVFIKSMLTTLRIQSIDDVGAIRQESIRVRIVPYHLLRIPGNSNLVALAWRPPCERRVCAAYHGDVVPAISSTYITSKPLKYASMRVDQTHWSLLTPPSYKQPVRGFVRVCKCNLLLVEYLRKE